MPKLIHGIVHGFSGHEKSGDKTTCPVPRCKWFFSGRSFLVLGSEQFHALLDGVAKDEDPAQFVSQAEKLSFRIYAGV